MLQVVTHNGLLPSLGGKRLGYLFSRNDGSTGSVPVTLLAAFQPPQPKPQPFKLAMAPTTAATNPLTRNAQKAPIRVRRDSNYGDARCSSCEGYTGSQAVPVKLGRVSCANCGQPMDVSV